VTTRFPGPSQPATRTAPPDAKAVSQIDSALAEIGQRADRYGVMLALRSELSSFAAMHELDAVMRQRCRDFPAQLAEWEAVVEYLEEVETKYAIALKAENAQPEN